MTAQDELPGQETGTASARPFRGPDRRQRPTPFLSRYSFRGGQRAGGRRPGEGKESFVDVYPAWVWGMLTLFLILNLLDAHFTLIYLQRGGEEGNPVAVRLLASGMGSFIGVKAAGVSVGAAVFCVLANFRNGRIGVFIALVFYQLLLFYHAALYFNWIGNVVS